MTLVKPLMRESEWDKETGYLFITVHSAGNSMHWLIVMPPMPVVKYVGTRLPRVVPQPLF